MYCGYITKIKDLRKHTNADRLQVGNCFGNQVIVDLDIKENELGCYFATDGRLGDEFCNANNLIRRKDAEGKNVGGFLEEGKQNIKTLKLRGEISDGLFLPLTAFESFCDISSLKEGDMITTLNGVMICEKYIPKSKNRVSNPNSKVKISIKPKNTFPLFTEHADTAQLCYNQSAFRQGDTCYITLKMHGTSQRTANTININTKNKFFDRVLNRLHIKSSTTQAWNYVSGTRRCVLTGFDGGFYGDNTFRKQHNDKFVGKLQKGEEVFYEVVGFTAPSSPIMGDVGNAKTQDKDFVKQYGETTRFSYGCEDGTSEAYVYRMTITNEDGYVVEYPWELVKLRCEQMGVNYVPELEKFIYTTQEDLMERVEKYYDGADPIGKTHIREGVVVRVDNRDKFTAFKHKNVWFKILEGIIKTDASVADMEEAQELNESESEGNE